ncbi:MAG: DeoR family transcriptional regulator, partial [Selenomonas sp.]|nr:DeoR family transcriptional regulator [Selenomonas sp.]
MNSRERRNFLLQELQEAKAVYVRELAQRLEVSDMTIRRDLHRLADMNIVTLVHGGAVLNEGTAALARGTTITIINLIGLTAMAGYVGAGGLGDYAITSGYNYNRMDIVW